jgi:hypothetical protein
MDKVEVHVSRELDFTPAQVWAVLGNFGDMSWTQGTERVEVVGNGIGMIRRIFMPGMDPIDEVLESFDDAALTFSYSIPRGLPMPVSDYLADVEVQALGDNRTRVNWHATAVPTGGVSAADASAILHGAYGQLLGWLEEHLQRG